MFLMLVEPGFHWRIITKTRQRPPHLQGNLLEQVILLFRWFGKNMHHIKDQAPVFTHPVSENSLLFLSSMIRVILYT